MKLKVNWKEMLTAMLKAAWPFLAGAVGGVLTGCTFGGIGPNFL